MAITFIESENLSENINGIRQYLIQHEDELSRVINIIKSVPESFKGDAADTFMAQFDRVHSDTARFLSQIDEFAKIVDNVRKSFDDADEKQRKQFANFFAN